MRLSVQGYGPRDLAWVSFFLVVLMAWATLFLMRPDVELPSGWEELGADYLASLCSPAGDYGFGGLAAMWSLMALAMMAPTAAPALKTYLDLTHTEGAGYAGFMGLAFGYILVWFGFSIPAAGLQLVLSKASLLDPIGRSSNAILSAGLLVLAGAYQFSKLKEACLRQCQSPFMFFIGNWQSGLFGAFRMGLHLGLVCLACCWALMLLAFVAGTMNLAFMALAMVLMTFEKIPQAGRHLTMPLGFMLLAAATMILGSEMTKQI